MNTNGEGVAVCSCGSALHVVCSGGCADPDVVFKSERAAIRKPLGVQDRPRPRKIAHFRPGFCTWPGCDEPIAPGHVGGKGRPWTKCAVHLEKTRGYSAKRQAKAAAQ